jgi:hypothetical protein
MMVEWSGASDLGAQVCRLLGFVFFSFLLLWSELEVKERGAFPLNLIVCGHLVRGGAVLSMGFFRSSLMAKGGSGLACLALELALGGATFICML